jgi:hypothetical protein
MAMSMSIPDIALRMVAGLCVPEKPIVLAQSETCWPRTGAGAVVSADAAPADSTRVPAARVVVTRMRTGFMIDAFRGGECAWSIRRTDIGGFTSRRDPVVSSTLTPWSIGSSEALCRNHEESLANHEARPLGTAGAASLPDTSGEAVHGGVRAGASERLALRPSHRDEIRPDSRTADSGGHRNRGSPISSIGFLNASRLRVGR